jgi:hypothetical protein
VLGADFMVDKDVVFEEEVVTIYSQSRCGGRDFAQVLAPLLAEEAMPKRKKPEQGASSSSSILPGVLIALLVLGGISSLM